MAKNDFDRILREIVQEIFVHYVERIMELEIVKSKSLPTKLTGTFENEVDHLVEAFTKSGKRLILHFEFQTQNDSKMLWRIQRYHGILYHKYGLPIHHFVIYLGQQKGRMKSKLDEDEVFSGFHLIPIANQKLESFLSARNPEEVLLGILSDFGSRESRESIQAIINVLKHTTENEIKLKRHLKQLGILARIRKLDKEVHQIIDQMPLEIYVEDSYLYQKGMKEGELKGKETGKVELTLQMVSQGIISINQAAEVLKISIEEMNRRIQEVKDDSGLE